MVLDRKSHWDNIYATKPLEKVGWYQPKPELSLDLIDKTGLSRSASIIDIGGGDSLLVDHLIELGYTQVTVLDISENAIDRAKKRLGEKAHLVRWMVGDVLDLPGHMKFDIWHDRATFHFFTTPQEIELYTQLASNMVRTGGYLIMGTFSDQGPTTCSGMPISQYSEGAMGRVLSKQFDKIHCYNIDHFTPDNCLQNYTFCYFKRI